MCVMGKVNEINFNKRWGMEEVGETMVWSEVFKQLQK